MAAVAAALLSVALVVVVGFARNPALRLAALALFAVPAVVAGYALVHGATRNMLDPGIGIAAMRNLNVLGESVLSRI